MCGVSDMFVGKLRPQLQTDCSSTLIGKDGKKHLTDSVTSTTIGNGVKINWDKIPVHLNRGREFRTTSKLPMGLSGLTNLHLCVSWRNESPGTGPILAQG